MSIDLQSQMKKILEEYGQEVEQIVQEEAESAVKNAVKKLKEKKRFAAGSNAKGEYARGWSSTIVHSRLGMKAVAFNKKHAQLTHLLENGHVSKNGTGRVFGEVKAYPHIAQINDEAEEEFVKGIERRVQG